MQEISLVQGGYFRVDSLLFFGKNRNFGDAKLLVDGKRKCRLQKRILMENSCPVEFTCIGTT